MPLATNLKSFCQTKIDAMNGEDPSRRDKMKEMMRDLTVFHPNGLKVFVEQTQWLEEFAVKIKAEESELVPYVTPYGAALGMLGVWNQILLVWIRTPWPLDSEVSDAKKNEGKAVVSDYLQKSVESYTRMIVK